MTEGVYFLNQVASLDVVKRFLSGLLAHHRTYSLNDIHTYFHNGCVMILVVPQVWILYKIVSKKLPYKLKLITFFSCTNNYVMSSNWIWYPTMENTHCPIASILLPHISLEIFEKNYHHVTSNCHFFRPFRLKSV